MYFPFTNFAQVLYIRIRQKFELFDLVAVSPSFEDTVITRQKPSRDTFL